MNYTQISPPGEAATTYVARWDLEGDVQRWKIEGMSPFDSIHDIKATRDHLIFSDLPFEFEPGALKGEERTLRNQDHTKLWIVDKDDLRTTPPGGTVQVREVQIPMPTGHLFADYEEVDGCIRVMLQQIPLSYLTISMTRETLDHKSGRAIDPNYEGLVTLALQPSVVSRYVIDADNGGVIDEARVWGGVLATTDTYRAEARAHQRQLWHACAGFDPDLVPEEWWALYGDPTDGVVAPVDLPTSFVAGSLARIDLESMKVAEVFSYDNGAFPSPPTFVPRKGAVDADDGYVIVVVHQDGPKQIQIFDANHIEAGPLACATSATFNPNLMLHSCWMADRVGPRRSSYRIPIARDLRGALTGIPGVLAGLVRMGKAMKR